MFEPSPRSASPPAGGDAGRTAAVATTSATCPGPALAVRYRPNMNLAAAQTKDADEASEPVPAAALALALLKEQHDSTAVHCLRCGHYEPAANPSPLSSTVKRVLICSQCPLRYGSRSWSHKPDPNRPPPISLI